MHVPSSARSCPFTHPYVPLGLPLGLLRQLLRGLSIPWQMHGRFAALVAFRLLRSIWRCEMSKGGGESEGP